MDCFFSDPASFDPVPAWDAPGPVASGTAGLAAFASSARTADEPCFPSAAAAKPGTAPAMHRPLTAAALHSLKAKLVLPRCCLLIAPHYFRYLPNPREGRETDMRARLPGTPAGYNEAMRPAAGESPVFRPLVRVAAALYPDSACGPPAARRAVDERASLARARRAPQSTAVIASNPILRRSPRGAE